MDTQKVKDALQDLIIRLQDAEKGYSEIYNATSNVVLKKWMKKYADERHGFHKALEYESKLLGGDPEVKTSFLGDLHRMFIDFKMSVIDDSFESIVNEIERGSKFLIDDYEKVLSDVVMSDTTKIVLTSQLQKIREELNSLVILNEELMAVC